MEGISRLAGPSFPPPRPWSGLGGLLASSVGPSAQLNLHSSCSVQERPLCPPLLLSQGSRSFPRTGGAGWDPSRICQSRAWTEQSLESDPAGAEREDVSLMNTVQCFRIIGVFWSLPLGLGLPLGRTARKISCTWIRFTHTHTPSAAERTQLLSHTHSPSSCTVRLHGNQ